MDCDYNNKNSAPFPLEGNGAPASIAETADLFDRSVGQIEQAYRDLGHALGWRFLTGPKATLSPRTRIGLITMNPGGDHEPEDHPRGSCEAGSAYLVEAWPGYARGRAPLQLQIQAMLGALARHLGDPSPLAQFMNERVLSAQYVPFRSPSFAALPRRRESLAFANGLWRGILAHWQPRLLITIDTETYSSLQATLLGHSAQIIDRQHLPTGWGDYQAEVIRLSRPDGAPPITLARLPHLSRFALFGRPASRPHMDVFLRRLAESIPD